MVLDASARPLVEMRSTLSALAVAVTTFDGKAEPTHLPLSPATADEAATDESAVRTIVGQAKLALMSAGDHMSALERALEAPVLTFSPWTIARTVLEATALVYWLLDPKDAALDRIAKSLVLRLLDIDGQVKFDNARIKEDLIADDSLKDLERRRRDVYRRTRDLGIAITCKKSKVTKLGAIPVSIPTIAIVEGFVKAESEYRMLSGAEHQRFSTLSQLSMRDMEGSGGKTQIPSMNLDFYQYLITSALKWYGAAAGRYFSYCGLDVGWLQERVNKAQGVVFSRSKRLRVANA